MLSKHDASKMSRFFHGGFFTVNGLPMQFRHINVCNTSVGNIYPEKEDFIPEKMIYYPPLAANIQSNLKLLCRIHENKRVDPMQGGEYFYNTTFRT